MSVNVTYVIGTCPDRAPYCVGYVAGQLCVVNCEGDLVLSQGSNRVMCRDDGTWSDVIPDCVSKYERNMLG